MIQVSQLYIYPIKSLAGIALTSTVITDRGFQYDRRWMLVDDNGRFLSQREHAQMALLQVELHTNGLLVYHKQNTGNLLSIPFEPARKEMIPVQIWDDTCDAQLVSQVADEWFSTVLQTNCRLVYMPDASRIQADLRYASEGDLTSFSDGYPILMISEASLNDLNAKATEPVPMNRFRPNLVISGASAYGENEMGAFHINEIIFKGAKPSARCVVTTIDQDTAIKQKEPLKTLSTYRGKNNKVYFGENVIAQQPGSIAVGDVLTISERKQPII